MFGVGDSILIVFAFVSSLGVLTLDFSIFERLNHKLAEKIAAQFGLYDVYFNQCSTQSLEMIRSLRYYEESYCESVVEVIAETLSLPEMFLILATASVKRALNLKTAVPSLKTQARMIANFYIDVAQLRLWSPSPPSGPYAHRLSSRWRRRKT